MSRPTTPTRPTEGPGPGRWLANLGGVLVVLAMGAALIWGWGEGQRRMAVANLVASLSDGSRELFPVADEAAGGPDSAADETPDFGALEEVRRLHAEPIAATAVADALTRALDRGDEATARRSLMMLEALDDVARPALPAVVRALDDGPTRPVRTLAIDLLIRLGPDDPATVPALARALAVDDPNDAALAAVARSAVEALSVLGTRAAPAVPQLARLLSHPDERLRDLSAEALGRIGPPAGVAVPRLIRLLDDPNSSAFTPAAVALARIAPDDPKVLEALEPLINDPNVDVQGLAREVVERHEALQAAESARETPAGKRLREFRPPDPAAPVAPRK